jgi:zinc transporter 2
VVIASLIIKFGGPSYQMADPICTLIFAVICLFTTAPVIKTCIDILMEASPKDLDIDELRQDFKDIKGVEDVHDLHVWELTSGKPSMTAHILGDKPDQILRDATVVCRKYGIYHSTIQIETGSQRESHGKFYIDCNHNLH